MIKGLKGLFQIDDNTFLQEYECQPKQFSFSKEGLTSFCDKYALSHEDVWRGLVGFREYYSEETIFSIAEFVLVQARQRGINEIESIRRYLWLRHSHEIKQSSRGIE